MAIILLSLWLLSYKASRIYGKGFHAEKRYFRFHLDFWLICQTVACINDFRGLREVARHIVMFVFNQSFVRSNYKYCLLSEIYGEVNDHKLVKINKESSKLYIKILYHHAKTWFQRKMIQQCWVYYAVKCFLVKFINMMKYDHLNDCHVQIHFIFGAQWFHVCKTQKENKWFWHENGVYRMISWHEGLVTPYGVMCLCLHRSGWYLSWQMVWLSPP